MLDPAVPRPASRLEELQERLGKYLGKYLAAKLVHIFRETREFLRRSRRKIRYGYRLWTPRGHEPAFLALYPDSMPGSEHIRNLYLRWVRGNMIYNNGDAPRFIALILNVNQLESEGIQGDVAELGVWRGNSAAILTDFAARSGKRVFLFDTFSGFDNRDFVGVDQNTRIQFTDTNIEYVKETVGHTDITTYITGFFPESITDEVTESTFALVHLDCDLYAPMKAALEFFYPRMPRGGMMIMHDYSSGHWAGAKNAIDEFCSATGEFLSLWPDKSGTAMIRKSK